MAYTRGCVGAHLRAGAVQLFGAHMQIRARFKLQALHVNRYSGSSRDEYVAIFKLMPNQSDAEPINGQVTLNVSKEKYDSLFIGKSYSFSLEEVQ
jgi:hypothetical protein